MRLQELAESLRAPLDAGREPAVYQPWVATGRVDFLEVFDGEGELSLGVRRAGLVVAAGVDQRRSAYGVWWNLSADDGLCGLLKSLAAEVLRPLALHVATQHFHSGVGGRRC